MWNDRGGTPECFCVWIMKLWNVLRMILVFVNIYRLWIFFQCPSYRRDSARFRIISLLSNFDSSKCPNCMSPVLNVFAYILGFVCSLDFLRFSSSHTLNGLGSYGSISYFNRLLIYISKFIGSISSAPQAKVGCYNSLPHTTSF